MAASSNMSSGTEFDCLTGVVPCYFAGVSTAAKGLKNPMAIRLNLDHLPDLQAYWGENRKTMACTVRAAWALVLRCYTGSEDICFGYDEIEVGGSDGGVPKQPDTSSGMSAARMIIGDATSFREVVERAKKGTFILSQDPGMSGSIKAPRISERPPFNTAVVLRIHTNPTGADAGAAFLRPTMNWALPEECRMRLLVKDLNSTRSIFLEWWYPDISAAFAMKVADVFLQVLSNILTKPDSVVGELDFLSERDRKQVFEWNATLPETVDRCVHEVIQDQARVRPDAEAVCAWDGSFTYYELDQLASKLACHLVELGVSQESRVALCFEKSKWNIVAMLGVLKAGGAFVPLDASHPRPRLQALVRAIDAAVFLCSQQQAALLATVAERVLPLDGSMIECLPTSLIVADSPPRATGKNAAYLIFTSGSTGEPKAVIVEHRAYCSSAKAHAPRFLTDSDSRVLQFSAHTFDASLIESLTTLMVGGCVCVPSEEARLNNVVALINEMRVTHAYLTPSFIGFMEPSAVPGLKTLVLAGEAMSQAHVAAWSTKVHLINGYGPTESSVAAAINSQVTSRSDCKDIGFPSGVRCWIVDSHDHDKLLPVGCTGELLLEGPTLAQGYWNDPQKTAKSFIYDPAWAKYDAPGGTGRRFYKTGDLVRYNSDAGSLTYVGRKDTQVKLHGQRVELGEIEHHLSADPNTKHGVVFLPKSGYFEQKLVAVLSVSDILLDNPAILPTPLKLVDQPTHVRCCAEIRERMSDRVPAYMVPTAWLCVEALPFLTSGKLNRKSVMEWLEDMTEDDYLQITPEIGPSDVKALESATETESQLLSIWSRVLNLPSARISLEHSFLSLGGDSITAMTCMNQCKRNGIGLTVQEVLRSKSIKELAASAKVINHRRIDYQETIDESFDLSPIQNLHFQVRDEKQGHFNQSFFLRVYRTIDEHTLRQAIEVLILHHSMLRARFSQDGPDMKWRQRVTREIATSYRLRTHIVCTQDDVKARIAESQACLDALVGPVVSIDLFKVNGHEQLLSMIGHHLVIDLVSWRVILEDLEELLLRPHASTLREAPLPFQTWCRLQADHCQNSNVQEVRPVDDFPASNFAYWGMKDRPNLYGDVVCEGFQVDSAVTSLLLTECNQALGTEPVDVLLSALLHSFGKAFTDRPAPAIYNEGHGREAWEPSIDISRTVGWFTVICPIVVPLRNCNSVVEVLKRVKDYRRGVPDNGRAYFANRILASYDDENYRQMELVFNYLGQYQQLERSGALFQPVEGLAGENRQGGGAADYAQSTPRFGLVEISAVVVQKKIRFSFSFNRYMNHQASIHKWISECHQTLVLLSKSLRSMTRQPTLSDFPLLPLTYEDLQSMVSERLVAMGIKSMVEIEDAYPCSPLQQGLLLSLTRDRSFYGVHVTYEVKRKAFDRVNAERLAQAWQKVVDRHAALRTVFAEHLTAKEPYCQIVLRNFVAEPVQLQCLDDGEVLQTLERQPPMEYTGRQPAHRFSICKTATGKVFCRLELSHTIMDGMSISIIFRDMEMAYAGVLVENQKPLFSGFMSYLQKEPQEAGIEYWRNYLSNMEPCYFPVLNDGRSAEKQLRTLQLDFQRLPALQSWCDEHGITLAMAFHAAWSLTLRCYCGSDEVCFGYLISERDVPVDGIEEAVGPMINMLACRVNMPGNARLNQFLDQIQEDYMNSLPYKHTSLAQVQHALQLTETALFNTCLSYRKLPSSHTSREPDITFSEHAPIHDPTEYLVSLNVEVTGKAVMIELDYWTDSLSDEMAANLASTFLKALENITDHSTDEVGRLNHLNDHNIQQIVTWNSIMPATINRCVHDLFEEQVKMQPESPAIHAWDGSFSYAQVNKLSSQLAHYLARVGVIPENLVALCFDKSAWMIISMLAVLKAGGGCVPLDATLPKAALDTRVLDTGAQVVLASPKRAYLLEDVVPYVITVSESVLDQLPAAEGPACPTIQPSNTAFVLFTSGSTGKPKGVVIEHRAFATSADAHGSVLGVGPDTRFMQFAAYTFDNSLEEMFTTLLRGGCVCVPSDHDRLNNLVGAVNKLGANFMDLTPTVAAYIQPSDVPNVKAIAVGGEVLTKEITELWGKAVPLHNLYGPTECSVNCTHNPNGGTSGEVGNIGRSIGSVSWVVDPSDHDYLVPVGCAGELLIEGPILARGYLNNREKTEQSFIENPLWVSTLQQHATAGDDNAEHTGLKRPTQRVYKTGDLVRYASDGSLVYLGRKDTQVKLNGQRIELGEIEHHVKKALPSECQSAVELTKIHSGTKVTKALVALVSHKTDGSVPAASADNIILPMSEDFISTAAALQKSLLSFLPAYMVPNLYMPVVQMPLTSSGKLNRRILRITAEEILNQDATLYRLGVTGGRAPSTRTEKFLQELWASVLSIDASTISADDTFFRHGGDSMGAILLVAAARKQGCILTVASVFQTPKLSDMAKNVTFTSETTLRDEPNGFLEPFSLLSEYGVLDDLKNEIASLCQVQIDAVDDIYPCSPMQEGLIALSNKRPGAYVTQNIYRLPADIDIERFQNAWQAVAESEVVLSTRVVYTKVYGFLQAVIREPLIWQSVHDIEAISETDRHLPSCNGDILSRYTIAGEGTDSRCFVWTAHHALYDGWSIPMLLSRVESYYLNPRAPERAFDSYYPRFIEHLMGIDTERSDQFWRERLTGTTSSQVFPLPRASHEVSAISKLRHITKIDRPPGMEITVPSLVRAAWALTLSVYSYSDDVVFGEILTGRDAPLSGIASMIGPTIAAVPMRIQIERELSVQELLVDIQKQAAGVLPYQFAGLQHIKTLSPDATVACGFQTMLAITHAGEDVNQSIWNLLSSESAGSSFHTYPLTISTTISDTRLDIDAHYDPVLIPTSQVERFLSQFETFLARLCSNSNAREKISHMELLSFQEWTTLQRWNGESLEFVHRCIHEMIDDIVRLQPEEMAVCSWDGTFTYWGLHQQSTRLAHRLIELGVCPDRETFVPICFEKSAFTIVAMLAILKAGGSFVPLDPQHPKSRLQEIVADLNADLVLCSPRYLTLCKTIAGKTLGIDFRLLNELPVQSCPTPACASNSAAYAIFTSGTTGKPKGSIVEHAAFCSGARKHGPALLIRPKSRVLQFASYTFDASLVEILTTLIVGGCVCVPDEYSRLNAMADVINNMKVDTAILTPSIAQMIDPSDVPGLRTLILAGEAMSPSHISTWGHKVDLVNGYGPSECSVVSAAKAHISVGTSPTNIGRGMGPCWIVDPINHDRLVPIGAVGELLVEGPTLARGYLNNERKTSESFIKNPKWTVADMSHSATQERRMYKTGDLVKYDPNDSGEMIYIGRKDHQAKLHGQRLELEEVEHHLNGDLAVRHGLVTLPAAGNCAKKLVAVLSLQALPVSTPTSGDLDMIDSSTASEHLVEIRERLGAHLPMYMIPSIWLVLRNLPLLASGKLDRRHIEQFVESMSDDTYQRIAAVGTPGSSNGLEMTNIERRLQIIWGNVLNLPREKIGLNCSFINLGGDSMSAMAVMSRCREEKLGVTVQDIISSKSISHLASLVTLPEEVSYQDEDDQEFDLSPIQQVYFQCMQGKQTQFNQSMLLHLTRVLDAEDVSHAFDELVKRHSMLRARFSQDEAGVWRQRITPYTQGSYHFRVYKAEESADIQNLIEDTQNSIDIVDGPVLAVSVFKSGSEDNQLFITAHHLVIDVVSWSLILPDLEDLLHSKAIMKQTPLSFQTWCRLQAANTPRVTSRRVLPFEEVPTADFAYWGMEGRPNTYGNTVTVETEIGEGISHELLGTCHAALQTEFIDVMMAALLMSFSRVFADREMPPAIYNEAHGREPWDPSIDLSRTVGWFTTLTPVHFPPDHIVRGDGDLLKCIRWVKDFRRRTPDKGRPYFAHRVMTAEGKQKFGQHLPTEIVFNYLGQYQNFERKDRLLQPVGGTGQSVNNLSDIGHEVPRFALIEISAAVIDGCLNLSFSYHKSMKRQASIRTWTIECQNLLREAPRKLMQIEAGRSLSDFPLLPLSYNGIHQLQENLLGIGISLDEVEDVYPCSPMQTGILLSQLKNPGLYAYESIFEVRSTQSGQSINLQQLADAWQHVAQCHPSLRTIFIGGTHGASLLDQVVIKSVKARILFCKCDEADVQKTLSELEPLNCSDKSPAHQFTLCKTSSGKIFCRIDISHAICDGSSMPLLLRDLSQAYMRETPKGSTGALYSDFIGYLYSKDTGSLYWKEYLDGVEPCLFPSLCAKDAEKKPGSHVLLLKQTTQLQEFCKDVGVTASNVLQLVWGLVLRCYTGSDEICFGYLTSGRDIPVRGIEDAIGAFINMLVCRLHITDDLTLGDALQKSQSDFVRSLEHQTTSLAEIHHELGLSETVLFNTAFTFQRRSNIDSTSPSLVFDAIDIHDPSEYRIAVNVEASDVSMEVLFSYWTDSLSEDHVRDLAATFEHVLDNILHSDQQHSRTIGGLDFFSERSCQQLRNWNNSPLDKIEKRVHEIIEEQTRRQPLSAPAVCAWDETFTYGELDKLSVRLATHLRGLGVGPDIFVPLCFEKSAWAIVAQLAVLKAGGAFVSLDPSHPESRLRNLIQDVGAHLVLCSSQYHEKVSRASEMARIVNRDTVCQLRDCPLTTLVTGANSSNAAYIIFTSGSTGKPKATVIEHGAICTSALAHSEAFFMNSNSRVFQFATYTFDASIMEILTTLMVGGCVCVPSDQERMDDLSGSIRRMNANWIFLTFSVANTLKPESVPTLKILVAGGEMMPGGFIEKWAGSVCLIEAYGPTECSVMATASLKVDLDGNRIDDDRTKIGKALCSRSWIVDPRNYNRLVPIGAVGELVLESFTVARGYLNNEQKTNESFIKDPEWTNHSGMQDILKQRERMYRTGDLVRYNLDGTISYIVRMDTQIKLNGQRIELGEIEYQCRQHLPDQTQVAVDLIVLGTQNFSKKLLGVFFTVQNGIINNDDSRKSVTLSGTSGNSNTNQLLLPMCQSMNSIAKILENSLSRVLPSYMIPKLYFPVSSLPWTSSGKLDRRRLQNMIQLLSKESLKPYSISSSRTKQSPKTKMEQMLQNLWEKVLNLATGSVGTEDSFFRLGGDSLVAMSLVGATRLQGISLTVVDIFRCPILADMAARCELLKENRQSVSKPFSLLHITEPIDQIIDDVAGRCRVKKQILSDIYPCSSLQEGLITLSVKQRGAYVSQNVFRLSESVNIRQFKAAWQQVVNEFDILRTRIVHTDASMKFLQVVLTEQSIIWHTARHLEDIPDETNTLPEDNGGLLTRYTIVEAKDSDERYFSWSIHHALYDGWSLSLVLKRLQDIYFECSSDLVGTPYAVFIDYLQKRDISTSDQFWKDYLLGVSSSHFPPAPKSPPIQSPDTQTLCSSTDIFTNPLSFNLTTPILIRAAWAMIVSAYASSEDVCFGETLTGRNVDLPGVTDIVGPTLTTIPTRIHVGRDMTVKDYLQEVRQVTTEIIPHQHAGLQHIRRLNGDTAVACDFQNLLVVQTGDDETDNRLWHLQDNGPAKAFFTYPLVIECLVPDSRVETNIYYDETVLSGWQVQRLLYQFASVLKQLSAVTQDDSRNVSEVEVFSPEDRAEVAYWNRESPCCIYQCIHELFRQRYLSQPEAPAVCAWDGELTYHQLNDYASQFAAYLSSLGVGPEVFVPICLDKSAWTVVTMMGILMAGGVIVPLDPAHPVRRHQEILEELNTSIILCSPKYSHRYLQFVRTLVKVDKDMITNIPLVNKSEKIVKQTTGSNMAYVIFTSGSTGRPKGIMIEHMAFASSSTAFEAATLMKSTSRVLQFSSLSFDAAMMEIFTTLTCGACVCVPSEEERLRDIAKAICQMGVSWMLLTPSVASLVDPATVPCLQVLVCGGEAMSQDVLKKWANRVELINAYGPTESAVIATVSTRVSDHSPSCIGYGISATLTWVVDSDNDDRLSPLGAVGELALEGPTLARGYLNDAQKTVESFVENPAWTASFTSLTSLPRRIYKTGDLVRYNPDGSLEYIGRKDNNVKLHGQRMDLGEIEHRLNIDPRVRRVMVLLPKTGLCQQRLIAVLSLSSLSTETAVLASSTCELVRDETRLKAAYSELVEVQNRLAGQLPSYMLPQTWSVVESLPMLVSGKLDRRRVKDWIENISEAAYEQIMEAKQDGECTTETTVIMKTLQEIWAVVLDLPIERVDLNRSFLSLGGDSILAMDVVSRCRKQKINLSLRDVLQSESIRHLAPTAGAGFASLQYEEKTDESFGLSPIQQLYFQSAKGYQGRSRFNQSMSLRLTQRTDCNTLESAIRRIIGQHSMLRARFSVNQDGTWQQRITTEIDSSYRYRVHQVNSTYATPPLIAETQECLDIQTGPIFAADLFEMPDENQMLFLVANHLCVDLVSWRIIFQDLQEILESGSLSCDKPLSFQVWNTLQAEHIKHEDDRNRPPYRILPADLRYWGMEGRHNTYSDVVHETFMLGEDITTSAMGHCHNALQTQPIDLFLSAVLHSFRRVFVHRHVPDLFNEGHGREPWESDIDLSRTVGWFTTICPLQVQLGSDDVVDTLRRTKDARRFRTAEGWFQFAGSDVPMEILFNYLGGIQQLQRDDSLFQHTDLLPDGPESMTAGDMGPDTTRFALFEISAMVTEGRLQFSFMYNRHMRHSQQIRQWISECKWTLEETIISLRRCPPEPTLSDYPLLPITYDGLRRLLKESFPKAGIAHRDQVEDIYPCSPVQEGILLRQLRDPNLYLFHAIFEIKHANPGFAVNVQHLREAWQKVVNRHAVLRTVFVDSICKGGAFDQIVFKKVESGIIQVECDDSDAFMELNSIKIREKNANRTPRLPHQVTFCTTSTGRLLIKMEIDHAVIDGMSTPVLLRDLASAYHGRLSEGNGPLYSDYIRYIGSQPATADITFWKEYLQGIQPCHFPRLKQNPLEERQQGHLKMEFNLWPELQKLCESQSITLAAVLQAAWALILRSYTSSDDVCFGYLSAGRDAPVNEIQDAVGVFINMLCCRVQFKPAQLLKEVPEKVRDEYFRSIRHQQCSLAEIQHELGLQGKALFNTALSIQNHSRSSMSEEGSLVFEPQMVYDPSEYAITLNIETAQKNEGVVFRYWTDMISNNHANTLATTLASVLTKFIKHSSQLVSQIDLLDAQIGKHLNRQCSDSHTMTEVEQEDIRHILDEHPALQKLIDERVREVVKEFLKPPTLAPQDSSATTGIVEGSLTTLEGQDHSIEADVSSTSCEDSFREEVARHSMTALVNRGRTAHIEQKLLCLWGSILDQAADSISKDDSFFELGGDSIAAMRLVGAAREVGLILTVADVFRHPVCEDMAAIIQIASGMSTDIRDFTGQNSSSSHAVDGELYQRFALLKATNVDDAFLQSRICPCIGVFRGGIADVLPVTDFQALAITGALLDSRWMLNYFYLDGRGPLDLRRLKQSCFRVVQAFDILRTVFVCAKDRFLQVILRKMQPEFFVYNADNSLEEFTAMLQQRDRGQSPRPGAPFVQFIVAKEKASDRHRIFIRLSHAQYDGVSLPKILSAIKAGYEGVPIPLTPSFASYVRTVTETITSDHYQHWKDLLKDSHMTNLVPRQGPSYHRSAGAVTTLKRSIRLPSMAHGNITAATVIKSVWALTLARLTARSDIVFGHTISGRNCAVPGVETLIGPCMNVIPVRIQFKENWTVLELLRQVQDQQVANMPFEALGFREIIKHCTDWPDWTNFSSIVQHQNVSRQEQMHLGDNTYHVGAAGSNEDFTDLTIVSIPRDRDMVELTVSYSPTSVITPSFAAKILDMVCSTADSFTENPSMLLPSPLALSTQPSEIIEDRVKLDDEQFASSQLKDLTRAEILVLSDVLSRTWQQVLSDRDGNCPALQLHSSFFDLNGDIINLAQLAWLLEQGDFTAPLEALVDHPTMLGQMAVLALHNSADKNQGSSSIGWSMAAPLAVGESSPARKAWGKNSWATTMSLARKLVRRNARNALTKSAHA